MINLKTLEAIEGLSTKRKTVKRSYKSKKTGAVKTKEYIYAKSELLFRKTKKGYKLIDENWKKFETNIKKAAKSETEAQSLINEARTIRHDILHGNELATFGSSVRHYKSDTQKGWNRIDVHSLVSRLSPTIITKYLINMGLSPEEVLKYINEELTARDKGLVELSELLNPGNWSNDTVQLTTSSDDVILVQIKFSYDGLSNIIVE